MHEQSQQTTEPNYPFNLFKHTTQNYRNPIKRCHYTCNNCKNMETKPFATKKTKTPITLPKPNQHYNCKTRNTVYLITCKYQNCGGQYVGYSMRRLQQRFIEPVIKAQ